MLEKRKIIAYFLISCFQLVVFAQKTTTKISVNPSEILIGQPATIDLTVNTSKGSNISLPMFKDTIVTGVEVLAVPKTDTVFTNDVMTISQKYIVTSFDSATYTIPYLAVIEGIDTLNSNSISLNVTSPQLTDSTLSYLNQIAQQHTDSIDFEQLGIYDIKPIQEPNFVWTDYLNYALFAVLILLIITAISIAIYLYYRKKKKGYYLKPKVIEPAHVIALNALNQIKEQKLWQQGREKEYYTELTNTLRDYLERRYHINAFEKTSEEILALVKGLIEDNTSFDELKQILKLADLVKFAKYKPLLDENDLSLLNAFLFVDQTKKEEENLNINSNQPQNNNQPSIDGDADDEKIDWTISHEDKN